MQSNLDALVTKLDHHLRDLDEVKNSIKQRDRALAITMAMTSDRNFEKSCSNNHKKEQVWDMFAKLRTGNADVKKLALENLIEYMREDDKAALLVADEGDICRLIHMLDSSLPVLRERAAHAVSVMAMVDECKKALVAEGALQPLLRVLEFGNLHAKERAVLALFEFTSIAENAHAVASHEGSIPLLVKLCKQGTPMGMTGAAGTMCNLARNEHIRRALAEKGAVQSLITLLTCSSCDARQQAAMALFNLASGKDDKIRMSIVRHGGMLSLLTFLKHSTSVDAQEIAIQALGKLATSATNVRALVSAGYATHLTELVNNAGSSRVQRLAALALCNLSSHMDSKRETCATPLIRVLEAKDISEQKVATLALSNAMLAKGKHHKDEMRAPGLLGLLHSCKKSLTKKLSLSALLTLSGTSTYKKRIMSAEVHPHFEKLAGTNVAGPNKALQRLGGKKLFGLFLKSKPPSSTTSSSA